MYAHHQIRGMRWEVHMACRGKGRGEVHTGFWWRNLMERVHLEDCDIDG